MDNFKLIYRILRYLEKAMDYDERTGVSPGKFADAEGCKSCERDCGCN